MVYKRFALIAALLAILASACGTSQESESLAPPSGPTAIRTPTAVPTPELTASPTPTAIVTLPLGESSKEVVELFFSSPEVVARAVLAAAFDMGSLAPTVSFWVDNLKPYIAVSPVIYQMYTWANYPVGTYPNVEKFMYLYLNDPWAHGEAAKQWLDSDPCTWPEEVQKQVEAVERKSPGRLRASIAQVTLGSQTAETVIRYITIGAGGRFYDDPEAYLNQFRCNVKSGTTAGRTPTARVTAANPVSTVTSIPTPTPSPAPVVEILDSPRDPSLAREILVSYLAEKLQEVASSTNVQNFANRLAYLTESAPIALEIYIAVGLKFTVEDEPVFYSAFLVHPGCVVGHPSLSEDQTTAFATEFSRRWPDVNPQTMPGLAEAEALTDAQMQGFCREFSDWIETKKPT